MPKLKKPTANIHRRVWYTQSHLILLNALDFFFSFFFLASYEPYKTFSLALSSLSLRRHAHGPLAKRLMHMAHFSGNTSGMSKSSYDWLN